MSVPKFTKTGNWLGVKKFISTLQKDMEKSKLIALKRWGLLAEKKAVKHMSSQDLNWQALRPSTISEKVKKGYSENTLIRSSTYFSAITSHVTGNIAFAGVKRENKKIANIAAIHEFGSKSRNIPARPLWQPVVDEMKIEVLKNKKLSPVKILFNEKK